jgi:hypothetical protein
MLIVTRNEIAEGNAAYTATFIDQWYLQYLRIGRLVRYVDDGCGRRLVFSQRRGTSITPRGGHN